MAIIVHWPFSTLAATPQLGSNRLESGRRADIANLSFVTWTGIRHRQLTHRKRFI
jgi:hypothetical protein